MIPLSLLRSPVVALDWHEAIALTAALTALVSDLQLRGVPRLEEVGLLPDGTLHLIGTALAPEPVAAALGARLASLIESRPCPSELRQFVDRQRQAPPDDDALERFAEGLAFFERPDRSDTLRALALRAPEAIERARLAEEIERLTERARQQSTLVPIEPPVVVSGHHAADYARQYAWPAAVAVVVFLTMAVAAATWLSSPAHAPTHPAEPDVALSEPDPGSRPASEPVEAEGPRAELPSSPAATTSGTPRSAGPDTTAAIRSTPGTEVGARSGMDVRVTELGGGPVPSTSATPAPSSSRSAAPSRVYTLGDPGVTPPRLVRPHLPAEPPSDVPPEQVGTLELLVNEHGTVDHVVLISPSNRYQERMLVAAAKAWFFEPATRQGQPVRFRTRIRVTL